MAIAVPEFTSPFDPANPVKDAYLWIASLALDNAAGTGRLTLNIHPNAAAHTAQPLAQINVTLGQVFQMGNQMAEPPVPEIAFPTLAQLMNDPEVANAYAMLGAKLYAALVAIVPALNGAMVVQD